jgi:hypothetical protein
MKCYYNHGMLSFSILSKTAYYLLSIIIMIKPFLPVLIFDCFVKIYAHFAFKNICIRILFIKLYNSFCVIPKPENTNEKHSSVVLKLSFIYVLLRAG